MVRAWSADFRAGRRRLGDLPTTLRSHYVSTPAVQRAFVERHAEAFSKHVGTHVENRRAAIRVGGVPYLLGDQPFDPRSPGAVPKLFHDRGAVVITGIGGAGKTTLALEIATQLLPPAGERLPVFVNAGGEPIADSIARAVREIVGEQHAPTDLLDGLLRAGRVVPIVDGLSELPEEARDSAQRILGDTPARHAVVTSRQEERIGEAPTLRVTVAPMSRLSDQTAFVEGCLARRGLPERSLAVVNRLDEWSKSRRNGIPLTPLWLTVFCDFEAEETADGALSASGTVEVVERYVALAVGRDRPDKTDLLGAVKELVQATIVELRLQPLDVAVAQARLGSGGADQLMELLRAGLLVSRNPPVDSIVGFRLEPLAEILFAAAKVDELQEELSAGSGTAEDLPGLVEFEAQARAAGEAAAGILLAAREQATSRGFEELLARIERLVEELLPRENPQDTGSAAEEATNPPPVLSRNPAGA